MLVKINKKVIIVFLICLTVLTVTFFFFNKIKLKGGTIVLDYGEKYKEKGYTASSFGKDYTKNVNVTNNINYKKLGKYKVEYSVKINNITYKKYRNVIIVDRKKPKIILKGSKKTNVCPGTKYKEEGYTVIDNYDKKLDKKVKVSKMKDKYIYVVVDSSGNKSKVTRTFKYRDITKPKISLNGDETTTVYIGNSYEEKGAQVIDNCDGDISNSVKIEGNVDNNKIGTYKIKYSVIDKANNENNIERTVNVVNKPSLNNGEPGTIYLTFDDGPNEGTTNVILDILKEEGVPATFFVTNNGPDYLIKREYDEGHTVALHTSTHNYAVVYASDESFYNDLKGVQDRVKRITGYTSMIIRFPGGSSNTVSSKYSPGIMSRLSQSTLAKGYKYYDWNISSGDAGGTTSSSGVYNNVVSALRKDRVNMILMHDIKTYTRDAIRQIIQFGKENGYKFEKITMDTPMITQRVNN